MEELQALYEALAAQSAVRFPGQKLVYGVGPASPLVMLVGEAPGAQEVLEGRPFAGQAGKKLDAFLSATGIPRERLFISNVVKLRPFVSGPSGRRRNRAPSREEIAFFIPWLEREIGLVRPGLLVALGNTPLQALTDGQRTVGETHGQVLPSRTGLPLYSLYHPAAVIYNRSLASVYQEDMRRLRDLLQRKGGIQ